jgi:phage baseplate assembly protein W
MPNRDISLSYEDGSTLTGADAIIQQYEIALFTSQTEFSSDPTFGIGLEDFISEPNNETTARAIKQQIISKTKSRFPEITIRKILIQRAQENQVTVQLDIIVLPYAEEGTIKKDIALT